MTLSVDEIKAALAEEYRGITLRRAEPVKGFHGIQYFLTGERIALAYNDAGPQGRASIQYRLPGDLSLRSPLTAWLDAVEDAVRIHDHKDERLRLGAEHDHNQHVGLVVENCPRCEEGSHDAEAAHIIATEYRAQRFVEVIESLIENLDWERERLVQEIARYKRDPLAKTDRSGIGGPVFIAQTVLHGIVQLPGRWRLDSVMEAGIAAEALAREKRAEA